MHTNKQAVVKFTLLSHTITLVHVRCPAVSGWAEIPVTIAQAEALDTIEKLKPIGLTENWKSTIDMLHQHLDADSCMGNEWENVEK